jgi:hypothetical protein
MQHKHDHSVPVCLLALWSDSLTYTMAKALSFSGHEVVVWVADVAKDSQSSWSLSRRIAVDPAATVIADAGAQPPEHIERLIVQGHPLLLGYGDILAKLAARADRMTVVSYGDRIRPYWQAIKLQWRERRWYGPWFAKVDRVVYKDGYYPIDLFGLLKPRRVVGFDAHSLFLNESDLYRSIHAADWDAEATRPYRANFIGSWDPEARGRILDSVEGFFRTDTGVKPGMFWHVFTDAQPAALSQMAFLQVLTQSDFTLAPPGYSLVTHRPVEALLRGSVPVLNANELDLYDLDLKDGTNCIAVPPGGWPASMERINDMDQAQVVAMRRNVLAMVAKRVAYPALSRDICRRLGIGDR